MKKLNCWKFNGCGREPGGSMVNEYGCCPAATEDSYNGVNDGANAGRICWAVAGTDSTAALCGFAAKLNNCEFCSFYQLVKEEQGPSFVRRCADLRCEVTTPPRHSNGS